MKVLLLSSKFPYPLKDGGAIATFQCFKGICKFAEKVHILSFNTSKHFVNQQDVNRSSFPGDSYTLVNLNTKPSAVKALINLAFSKKPYILQRFKSSDFRKKLEYLLKKIEFDIVQIEGLYMLQYIDNVRKHSNAKIAFRAHNLEHQIWEQLAIKAENFVKKAYLSSLAKRILRFEKESLNSYDLLLPISNEDLAYYQQLGSKLPAKVISTGFDFKGVEYVEIKTTQTKIFYIGSLEWRPNQEGLVWFLDNCWPIVKKEYSEVEFYVAGRNSPKWLEQKLKSSGVDFVGEVNSSTDFMKDKGIMIVPLFSGSGMRIKIVEAFMNSKAVVSTSAGVKGLPVSSNHLMVADEAESFAKNTINLITNQNLFNSLTKEAFTFAKTNYNNEMISHKLYEFYKANIN